MSIADNCGEAYPARKYAYAINVEEKDNLKYSHINYLKQISFF